MINATITNLSVFSAEVITSKTGTQYLSVRGSVGTGLKTGRKTADGKDEYGREWVTFSLFGNDMEHFKGKLAKGVHLNLTGKIAVEAYTSRQDGSANANIKVQFPDIEIVNLGTEASGEAKASATAQTAPAPVTPIAPAPLAATGTVDATPDNFDEFPFA